MRLSLSRVPIETPIFILDIGHGENETDTDSSSGAAVPPDPALPNGPPETVQTVVPQLLIDHYISMVDPSRAQTVDSEIARHCAFSLPAVALTLGRSNWPQLRSTYENLASDMQWKVRRTLASSIHELGVILGTDVTSAELIPIFNGFLKDLDEVRIGLLKHLEDFFLLLKPEDRIEYLPKLSEFLKMDNERNWRFRKELGSQLRGLVPLFSASHVDEFITPIALFLVRDKVACVRQTAISVVAVIVRKLSDGDREGDSLLCGNLLKCLQESLASDSLWVHRQTYAFLAGKISEEEAVPKSAFVETVLPSLLQLAEDKVPNVRLSVARTMNALKKDEVLPMANRVGEEDGGDGGGDYQPEISLIDNQRLDIIENNLKNDPDIDVRYAYEVNQSHSAVTLDDD